MIINCKTTTKVKIIALLLLDNHNHQIEINILQVTDILSAKYLLRLYQQVPLAQLAVTTGCQ